MDPIASALVTFIVRVTTSTFTAIAKALIAALWIALKSKIVLGAAILGFSALGAGLIVWSYMVTGWNQAALLGFGTSLLIVGTVELGILGVLNKVIDPDKSPDLIEKLGRDLDKRFTELENLLIINQAAHHLSEKSAVQHQSATKPT